MARSVVMCRLTIKPCVVGTAVIFRKLFHMSMSNRDILAAGALASPEPLKTVDTLLGPTALMRSKLACMMTSSTTTTSASNSGCRGLARWSAD